MNVPSKTRILFLVMQFEVFFYPIFCILQIILLGVITKKLTEIAMLTLTLTPPNQMAHELKVNRECFEFINVKLNPSMHV